MDVKMGELDPRLRASHHHLRSGSKAGSSHLTGRGKKHKPMEQTRVSEDPCLRKDSGGNISRLVKAWCKWLRAEAPGAGSAGSSCTVVMARLCSHTNS